MIHKDHIRKVYGSNANVISRGDSAWRNPDRVSPHSHEVSGERGYLNPYSKQQQKLLQHSDRYRDHLEAVLEGLSDRERDELTEIQVSDGTDLVKYVKVDGHWRRRWIHRNAAL